MISTPSPFYPPDPHAEPIANILWRAYGISWDESLEIPLKQRQALYDKAVEVLAEDRAELFKALAMILHFNPSMVDENNNGV